MKLIENYMHSKKNVYKKYIYIKYSHAARFHSSFYCFHFLKFMSFNLVNAEV